MKKSGNQLDLFIDDYCFACGSKNAAGLRLEIKPQEEITPHGIRKKAVCHFTPLTEYQGYGKIIHGGILSTVLDELMIYSLRYQEISSITAKIEVVFKQKVLVGEPLRGEAWMVKNRKKIVQAEGKIFNLQGNLLASAKGLFVKVDGIGRK